MDSRVDGNSIHVFGLRFAIHLGVGICLNRA